MAYQMIYTSIRSGLVAGRSGFCTAARHREIKESLVARIEDFSSQYDRSLVDGSPPVIYSHRIVTIREDRYHVLMRTGDAGNDYSGRTNHIAHAVILTPDEISSLRITPAEAILALLREGIWQTRYEEAARFFGAEEVIDFSNFSSDLTLPASHWEKATGSAANAAQLYGSSGPIDAGIEIAAADNAGASQLLLLFAESLLLIDSHRANPGATWATPFTTALQSNAESRQFTWCGCIAGSHLQSRERSAGRAILVLNSDLPLPTGTWASIAQTGEAPPEPSQIESERGGVEIPASNIANHEEPLGAALTSPSAEPSQSSHSTSLPDQGEGIPLPSSILIPDSENGRRREKRNRNPLPSILGVLGVSIVLLFAAVWLLRHGNREVRDREEKLRTMVSDGSWREIRGYIRGPEVPGEFRDKSDYIDTVHHAAEAIVAYRDLKRRPDLPSKAFTGAKTASDAIERIGTEWGDAVDGETEIGNEVNQSRAEAQSSVDAFEEAKTSVQEIYPTLESALKNSNREPTEFPPREKLDTAREKLESLKEKASTDTLKPLHEEFKRVEDKLIPAISLILDTDLNYDSQYELGEAKAQLEKEIGPLKSELESLSELFPSRSRPYDVTMGALKGLNALPGKLQVPEYHSKPPPKKEVVASDEKTGEDDSKSNLAPSPKIFLLPMPDDNQFEIKELPLGADPFASECRLIPIQGGANSIEPLPLIRRGASILLTTRNRLFELNEQTLDLDPGDKVAEDAWAPFRNGFRLELGSAEEPEKWIHVAFAPFARTSSASFLRSRSVDEVVSKQNGTLRIREAELEYLSNIELPTLPETTWKVEFSSGDDVVAHEVEVLSDLIDPLEKLTPYLEKLREEREIAEKQATQADTIAQIRNLDERLFPSIVKEEQESLRVSITGPPFVIESGISKGGPLRLPNYKTSDRAGMVREFLLHRLDLLDDHASGAETYNKAYPAIERLIKGPKQDENPELQDWFTRCVQFSTDLKKGGWVKPVPESPKGGEHNTKEDAEKALKEYSAEVCAREFFRGWVKVFTPENAKVFREYARSGGAPTGRSIEEIDTEIETCQKRMLAFEPDSFLKSGEVKIFLHYTIKKTNSPDLEARFIPVLIGTKKQ